MKVEVTIELEINLRNASIADIQKLVEQMIDLKKFDALEAVAVKDVKIAQ